MSPQIYIHLISLVQRLRPHSFSIGLVIGIALLSVSLFTYSALIGIAPITLSQSVFRSLYILIGALFSIMLGLVVLRAARLWRARQHDDAGARLHVKLVFFFGAVALVPALVVSIFATVHLNRGLDAGFLRSADDLVASSQDLATLYAHEQQRLLGRQVMLMVGDFDREARRLDLDPLPITKDILRFQALLRQFDLILLLEPNGQIITRAQINPNLILDPPAAAILKQVTSRPLIFRHQDIPSLIGMLVRRRDDPERIFYVARVLNPQIVNDLETISAAAIDYRIVRDHRNDIEISFARTYIGLSLIFLLIAIWIGLNIAGRLATPIQSLIGAARRVAGGDLTVNVKVPTSDIDLATLCQTFNSMVGDISHQRDALISVNDRLEQRRRLLEAVLSGISTSVVGLDQDRKIMLANRSALLSLDIDPQKAYQSTLTELIPQVEDLLAQAQNTSGQIVQQQIITPGRGGKSRVFDFRISGDASPIEGIRYVAAFDDITAFLAAQRLSTWRDIARRVAHEIKNPLTPIQLATERLKRRYGHQIDADDPAFSQCIEIILRQVGDIRRMIDEFSAFARMPKPLIRDELLASIIDEAVFEQKIATPDIIFQTAYTNSKIRLRCDRRQIYQCLVNLLRNAVHSTNRYRADHPQTNNDNDPIRVTLEQNDTHATLTVTDHGTGLPAMNREKLTDPYVTNHIGGTGLGLAVVLKIVQDHGGHLDFGDHHGTQHGALVQIMLPYNPPEPNPSRSLPVTVQHLQPTPEPA